MAEQAICQFVFCVECPILMKTAIIILGNSWVCPYVNTYKNALEKLGCVYDVILWDRDGSDSSAPIRFDSGRMNLDNPVLKSLAYIRYSRFIKKILLKNRYDRIVVSGPHLAILLSSFLRKRYKGKYIIDYRDIAVEQKRLFASAFSKALAGSYCNVISSPGFKEYLPGCYNYHISHNFDYDAAMRSLENSYPLWKGGLPLKVLTIGYIRNYCSNVKILQSLGNNNDYCLKFVGRGDATGTLQGYALSHSVANVDFYGFYKKEDEVTFVRDCDFINIYFPDDIEHSAIMSNRFYLALIYKKPVIVTAGSIQASLAEKYGLGVVVDDCTNLDAEIKKYISAFDYGIFCDKCNELLSLFAQEHRCLEKSIADFVRM